MIVVTIFLFTLNSCKKDDSSTTDPANNPNGTFLASTTETNKVGLLEDFTGVRCGYCPDGHARAKVIYDANPGKFVIIAVNNGQYAAPQAGWANFTTKYGDALISQAKVSGYPAGSINRVLCSTLGVQAQIGGGYAMSRSAWAQAASTIMGQKAPVNIGATATFNKTSRVLTVKVDLYYVNEVTGSNNLNVALLQDNIYCKHSGGTPDANNYQVNHVLRDMITGQWGTVVSASGQAKGSKVSKTFTYTVPADYNGATIPPGGGTVVIDDLKVAIFVANGQTDILNALEIDVK